MRKVISVVVPTFNRLEIIQDTLNSVFHQSYRPIELLVVDDGSTDDTKNVVEQWKSEHENEEFIVKYLSQPNSGAPVARNYGMHTSTGEFICFLDSDDMYRPQFASFMVQKLRESPDVDCVICGMQYCDTLDILPSADENLPDCTWTSVGLNFGKEFWCTENVLYKKARLIATGGWNEVLRYGWQDRELCLRLQLLGFRYIRCDIPLIICRASGSDKLSNLAKSKDPRFLAGITNAACSLSAIAIRKRQWGPLIWLLSRWFKWSIELSLVKLKAIHERIVTRASVTK